MFGFKKLYKNLADVNAEISMSVENYKPKTKIEYDDKKELLVF